jgi:hypothetical protein
MQHVSRYAMGSLVCLLCSGLSLGVYFIASHQDIGFGWIGVLVIVCWPTAAFSLLTGTLIGLVGLFVSRDWQFRLQAFFAGLFCGGCLFWLLKGFFAR